MIDYPLKFQPILKDKIWGGSKLKTLLNKETTSDCLGESWEISSVEHNVSIVSNGTFRDKSLTDLIKIFKEELLGTQVYETFGDRFPLLVKFIDAKLDLSVQLHPNDQLAKKRHNSFGKAEMWHIVQADEASKLIIGFNQVVDKEIYQKALRKGELTSLLNFKKTKKGDSFFINTGTIHAIGAGVLIAEIQQTSDITYRVFDWNRKNINGEERVLHTDLASKAINYGTTDHEKLKYDELNSPSNIVSTEYFTTNYIHVDDKLIRRFNEIDSFKIYMCVQGEGFVTVNLNKEHISLGETVLIPALCKEIILEGNGMVLLEVYIEDKFL